EVLIMVCPPGAGKTKFIETHLQPKGYLPVDSELWGLPDLLQLGFSVVIDGCHPTHTERETIQRLVMPSSVRVIWIIGAAAGEEMAKRTYAVSFERPEGMEVIRVD